MTVLAGNPCSGKNNLFVLSYFVLISSSMKLGPAVVNPSFVRSNNFGSFGGGGGGGGGGRGDSYQL